MNCSSKTGRFPYEARPQATPRIVDSASGELKTCFGKFGGKLLRQTEDAAFRIFDVFAKNDAPRISLEPRAQRFVDRIADAVFARREHLVGQLRRFRRDVKLQFVGGRICLALRLGEFLPDPLFDFVVELVVFLRRDHAFIDQLLFPALERIAFLQVLKFLRAAIKFLVVAARVAGKPFHLHPQKGGPLAGAQPLDRLGRDVVNCLDIGAVDLDPVARLKNADARAD